MPKPDRYPRKRSRKVTIEPKPFPFLQLPREIRDAIYTFALPRSLGPLRPQPASTSKEENERWALIDDFPQCRWDCGSLALLRVSKQIGAEAAEIFWKSNIFDLRFDTNPPQIEMWCDNVLQGGRNFSGKVIKRLSDITAEHARLVRGWCLAFPTHCGLGNAKQAALEKELWEQYKLSLPPPLNRRLTQRHSLELDNFRRFYLAERRSNESEDRTAYRDHVADGTASWLRLIGPEPRLTHLELSFYRYFHCGYSGWPDFDLCSRILAMFPERVQKLTVRINGTFFTSTGPFGNCRPVMESWAKQQSSFVARPKPTELAGVTETADEPSRSRAGQENCYPLQPVKH